MQNAREGQNVSETQQQVGCDAHIFLICTSDLYDYLDYVCLGIEYTWQNICMEKQLQFHEEAFMAAELSPLCQFNI